MAVTLNLSLATVHDVAKQFDDAFAQLKAAHGERLGRAKLDVELGLAGARIGLMVLEGGTATSLTSAALDACVHAWVKQMLHLEPASQLVRWKILADPSMLLVSCVERTAFESLEQLAKAQGMRFVACKPAVLAALSAVRDQPDEATLVWTEAAPGSTRSSIVQLLRFERAQLRAAWRGWVPPPAAGSNDSALVGALRRFQAHHRCRTDAPVTYLHWPPPPGAARV